MCPTTPFFLVSTLLALKQYYYIAPFVEDRFSISRHKKILYIEKKYDFLEYTQPFVIKNAQLFTSLIKNFDTLQDAVAHGTDFFFFNFFSG